MSRSSASRKVDFQCGSLPYRAPPRRKVSPEYANGIKLTIGDDLEFRPIGETGGHRRINLAGAHGVWERSFTIQQAHEVLGNERLAGQARTRARLLKIINFPPRGDQAKECLVETEHAFDGAMPQIVERKEGMFPAPGAAAVRPEARESGGTVATFFQLNEHGLLPPQQDGARQLQALVARRALRRRRNTPPK